MEMFKKVLKMDAKTAASYNADVLQLLKPKQKPVPRLTDKELSKAIKQFKACALNCYNLQALQELGFTADHVKTVADLKECLILAVGESLRSNSIIERVIRRQKRLEAEIQTIINWFKNNPSFNDLDNAGFKNHDLKQVISAVMDDTKRAQVLSAIKYQNHTAKPVGFGDTPAPASSHKVFRAARGKSGKGVTVNAKELGMTRSERRRATSDDVMQIARLVKSI
jgi:uncharacterized protein (UPF0335 family)